MTGNKSASFVNDWITIYTTIFSISLQLKDEKSEKYFSLCEQKLLTPNPKHTCMCGTKLSCINVYAIQLNNYQL